MRCEKGRRRVIEEDLVYINEEAFETIGAFKVLSMVFGMDAIRSA